MNYKKITLFFIIGILVAIGIYDVWVIKSAGTEASISWVIIEWSHKHPVFTFMIGFSMGHLFWRMKNPNIICPNCKHEFNERKSLKKV